MKYLKKETKESKENRLCGAQNLQKKDWNRMKEKFDKISK